MAIGRIPEPGTGIPESIIAAKGDLLTGTANDTPAVLTAGTNETRLVADSGEATGLKYVADTTNYAVAAKGDLLVGTAADTVAPLTVGADGTTLVADSSEATGLKWATASSGGMTLISTTTLLNRQTDLTSIPGTYNDLVIIINGANFPTYNTQISLRPNGSTTIVTTDNRQNSGGSNNSSVTTNSELNLSGGYNISNSSSNNTWAIRIFNYANTSYYKAITNFGYLEQSGGTATAVGSWGGIATNSAITSLTLFLGQNVTYNSGQILLYGVK